MGNRHVRLVQRGRFMKLIKRNIYIDELCTLMNTPDIKIITGVRRCGKSKLMESFIKEIKKKDNNSNIIHINFNLTKFEDLLEYHELENYIDKHFSEEQNNYLLIDEVQMCPHFEKAINSLHAKEKYDIYVTGSNAFLQSSDLATLFVGRTYQVHILPFCFSEYLAYFTSKNIYESLTNYINDGGMPGSYLYTKKNQKYHYIDSEILNTLIVRDIINKNKIRNTPILYKLIDYLMDNIGNIISTRSICESFTRNKTTVDHKTIDKYIDYLCRTYAFYKVRRYDVKGKKYLRYKGKYYLSDHSFKYARLGTKNMDYGYVLENIVAIELIRRGYEVYVGALHNKEIDFVTINQGEKQYIQVAYDISDKKTFDREISSLLDIKDAYPKILLARTYQPEYQYEGIKILDVADWLQNTSIT